MLRNNQYEKYNKNRDTQIGWYNPRIEIVRLDSVDDRDHSDTEEERYGSTISICDDEDRDSRDKCTKNRDKSEYEHDERKSEYKWENMISMYQAHDDESSRCEDSIDESDDWLSSEYRSKSESDLAGDDRIFSIEKCKIPSLHLRKKIDNMFPLHHEYIWHHDGDHELGEDDPRVSQVSESCLSYRLECLGIDDISDDLSESEIDRESPLDLTSKSLELCCDAGSTSDELSHLTDNLWDDIDE